jgi:elongation factor P
MLSLTEIKLGKVLTINGEPYLVVRADHHKVARGGATLKTKLKNLLSGNIIERTWQGNDKAEEADVEKRKANFLYKDEAWAYFMDAESYEQFSINVEDLGGKEKFMKDGIDVMVLYFEGKPMSIELPIKVELQVKSAPPGVRGNSAGNVTKTAELETGAMISVPMFVETGDIIRVNTENEEYAERA